MPYAPLTAADFDLAFPSSRRMFVEGPQGVRVPMREIALSGGVAPLAVYDASGPRHVDVHVGLPALRTTWIRQRADVETPAAERGGRSSARRPAGR